MYKARKRKHLDQFLLSLFIIFYTQASAGPSGRLLVCLSGGNDMTKKVDFKLNLRGLNELMKGPECQSVLAERGSEVLSRADGMKEIKRAEYSASTKPLNWIAVTTVRCDNALAVKDCLKHNTLIKALGGGS